ncbi:MAG: type II toxin-antitoxin system VapC family toxin [Deltaproteobacteria bacterium]|nr:type II toxin-antitoxin system VapC family toxin [Deltaproteobacteria bacterium]
MKIMLDTTAYVGFKRNDIETVEIILQAEQILFSPVVLGELMFGFRNGTRFKENMAYSRIAAQLKRQGTPIPNNDIWIAAQTQEHGAELITFDQHFKRISGLVCTIFNGLYSN